jgi:hypothetical protein
MESKSAIFFENMFPFKKVHENHSFQRTIETSSSSHHQLEVDEIDMGRSTRVKKINTCDLDFLIYLL